MTQSVVTIPLDENEVDAQTAKDAARDAKVNAAVGEVVAATGKKGQLTLGECGMHDFSSPNYGKKRGWAAICQDRHDRGISRKQRRLKKQAQAAN
jgi:hypothetical protein